MASFHPTGKEFYNFAFGGDLSFPGEYWSVARRLYMTYVKESVTFAELILCWQQLIVSSDSLSYPKLLKKN
jgi:hypothetical protein